MRVVVLGHMGMLGKRVMQEAQARGHEVITPFVPGTNRPARLIALHTTDVEGDAVINCAGIVKQRSNDPMELTLTNAFAPHYIAKLCTQAGSRLIHVSTDCVFSHKGPHVEDSPVSPEDLYGKTKLAGEVDSPHLTVRTSFIGFSTRGLVNDVLNKPTIRVSNRLLWNGHTAETVAKFLLLMAELKYSGLIHFPGEDYSRYQLVRKLAGWLNVHPDIERDDSFVADRRLASNKSEWRSHWPDMPFTLDEELRGMRA